MKTFEELCPVWSQRVTELEDIIKYRMYKDDVHTFEFCIVGEAHLDKPFEQQKHEKQNREPRYREPRWMFICSECLILSDKIAITYSTYRKAMFDLITEFVEHYNDKHIEKSPVQKGDMKIK